MIKIYQDLYSKVDWSLWSIRKKNYPVNKEIRIKTPILRADLCDFSDACIVVKGGTTVTKPDNAKRKKNEKCYI